MEQLETFVKDITTINDSLEELFIKKVLLRLNCFGYKYNKEDNWCIVFTIDKVINSIKFFCNIKEIPKDLDEKIVDKVVGEFLFVKKQSNQLNIDNFDLDIAIKSLKAGDVNFTFATGEGSNTDEAKLTSLINYLMNLRKEDLVCYRKLKW